MINSDDRSSTGKLMIDANNVISDDVAFEIRKTGIDILGVGKGHW